MFKMDWLYTMYILHGKYAQIHGIPSNYFNLTSFIFRWTQKMIAIVDI